MISNKIGGNLANQYQEYYGISTDTKPEKAFNNSLFIEQDTLDIYYFDGNAQIWRKMGEQIPKPSRKVGF